jgi:hypothetical protein
MGPKWTTNSPKKFNVAACLCQRVKMHYRMLKLKMAIATIRSIKVVLFGLVTLNEG